MFAFKAPIGRLLARLKVGGEAAKVFFVDLGKELRAAAMESSQRTKAFSADLRKGKLVLSVIVGAYLWIGFWKSAEDGVTRDIPILPRHSQEAMKDSLTATGVGGHIPTEKPGKKITSLAPYIPVAVLISLGLDVLGLSSSQRLRQHFSKAALQPLIGASPK